MRQPFAWMLLLVAGCSASPDEPTGDGSDVAPRLAGRRLSESEVSTALRSAGFSASTIPAMVCAAKYESSFYTEALHKNHNGSIDYGLFQINDVLWAGKCGLTVSGLYDPAKNAHCAKKVYDSGGLHSWYGYTKHQRECDAYSVSQ